ncbi:MAG: DUF1292 domain-containing protein [Clostridia bacterium]|nr:DUF1292 domain-containing protein [Clostridia bacterium]
MGLLRYGEKRASKGNGDVKDITVKKIGWRRIAKNTCRFGWAYVNPDSDSDEIIEPFSKKGTTKVELLFVRSDAVTKGKSAVHTLEFIYNLIFLLRRIVAFLLPILAVVGIVVSVIKREEGVKTAVMFVLIALLVWIACIIAEGVLARCAASKLRSQGASPSKVGGKKSGHAPSDRLPSERHYDYDEDDDVITLTDANGKEINLVEIAGIAYRGNFYAILQPVELLDGMGEDEALVFKVSRNRDGEDKFEIELDDKIIDAVFAEYNRLLDEAEKK